MKYRSDYLGRMQWIEYPDGELITYGYDNGGQVISVTGEHWNKNFEYVTNILYDQYGQRTRIDYGNGTFTEYNYDPTRRWLDTIKTCKGDATGNPLKTYQNIKYNFDAVGNVTSYENNCMDNVRGNYKTTQSYTYDSLYQLTGVEGSSSYTPDHSVVYKSTYSQVFDFDDYGLGNMVTKTSKEDITPWHRIGDDLNYELDYEYDYDNYSHRRIRAGNRYYKYDANGNIICEQDGSFESNGDDTSYHKINREADTVYSTDYGWGLFRDDSQDVNKLHSRYKRTYSWNEKNQLVLSVDANYTTSYIYSQDGERTNKYTSSSETLYFNKMWSLHTDAGNSIHGGQYAKNVYLGETRIVTKLCLRNDPRADAEELQQYFYHSDHLGSASLISDYKGDEYQRIEYTPYGETWIERTDNKGLEYLPYKFTAKELDPETGLYYYGARYLDSKYSTWISTDPALSDYIPQAPINDEAKRHNQNLPGMGGIFNHINANLYAYAANNPIKYTDPDGRAPRNMTEAQRTAYKNKVQSMKPSDIPNDHDCADTALYIYDKSYEAATGTKNGFKNITKDGKKLDILKNVQAKDLFGTLNKDNKNINYYKADGTGQTYDSSLADRSFNSSNIEVGTVGLYKPKSGVTGFSGHTITVTGVSRDANGNVLSISYIEGHMGDSEQEEHTFTREAGAAGNSSLHNRYSNCIFVGWGEFEP